MERLTDFVVDASPMEPFAPAILDNVAAEYFELPSEEQMLPARYMLTVAPIRQAQRAKIPAMTHVDGSARLQTVPREWTPMYYRLIEKFGEATGVPVLLNTSFNLRGEPVVNTAEEALSTFVRSGIDLLVMGNTVVAKNRNVMFP
ncbi:MAG: carbamoyltransferase C-terminal domain-containing protein [Chloroflexota bacterium]